ncbi:MAG: PAS domain-containing protein [Desulfarculus sp.]|nr:PAS domain-containing protein [Desulfarculus sp.]
MTLRAKLLLAQVPLWAALLLVGLLALFTTAALGRQSHDILSENYRSVREVRSMTESLERLHDLAQASALAGQAWSGPQVARHMERFEQSLRGQDTAVAEAGESEATQELHQAWQRYRESYKRIMGLDQAGPGAKAFSDLLMPAFLAVKKAQDQIVEINQRAMEVKSGQARLQAGHFQTTMAIVSLAALAGGLALTLWLTTQLLRPLSVLGQALLRIGGGDFETRVRLSGRDEITQLAGRVNDMASRLLAYRQSSLGALLLAQEASQATLNSLSDPVLVLDLEGRLVNLNQAAEGLFGLPPQSGQPAWEGLDPGLAQRVRELLAQVVEGRGSVAPKGFQEAFRLSGAQGGRYLLPRAAPVLDPGGGLAGATLVLQDVTRLWRFDRMKTDMVATVAHEFRTPLTSLGMAIHLCLEGAAGPLSAKQADLLAAARQDCERVKAMVEDLLDMSRLGQDGYSLRRLPVEAAWLLAQAHQAHQAAAQRRGVELALGQGPGPARVSADPERVGLVFSNLIANALRHTPAGGRVVLEALAREGAVLFSVTDTGEGIEPERLPHVFERFQGAGEEPAGAAGLGLYIAREAVLAHGGEIGLESQPGQGSRLWFTLPAA